MTQRNPMNDRYNDENHTGKTRKSSASAKPKAARAATVRDPAPKTKKQKKEEARERERKAAQKAEALNSRYEQTDEYKRLRRIWWVLLVAAIAATICSWLITQNPDLAGFSPVALVLAYGLIIGAFWLDLGKIRKQRKLYNASIMNSNSKEARREQKKLRAERREQEKEAEEKYAAAKAEEEAKKAEGGGPFGWFMKSRKKAEEAPAEAAGESAEKEGKAASDASEKQGDSKKEA